MAGVSFRATPIELEDIDWTTVDWHFVLKVMHVAL
jgi:hypothetical protein